MPDVNDIPDNELLQRVLRNLRSRGRSREKLGRDELCDLELAERGFGWQWLTREGVDFSVTVMMYGEEKDKWRRQRARL